MASPRSELGGLVAEEMVDQNQCHHGFGHGHSAGSDAGIVPSLNLDFGFFAFLGDGVLLAVDGRRGFHHHTHYDIVTVRNAAEDAAGIVGFRSNGIISLNILNTQYEMG